MIRVQAAVLLATVITGCGSTPPPDLDPPSARAPVEARPEFSRLIEQLGADSIEARQEAQAGLMRAGAAASPFLVKALGHSDAQVARSAKTILTELNRRPIRGFPAHELNFQDAFAFRAGEVDNSYFLVGMGIFAGYVKDTTAVAIREWLQSRPRARAVPVSSFDAVSLTNPDTAGKWCYVWIEDDTENLNLHMVELGLAPGHVMQSHTTDLFVSASEYSDFLERVRSAQTKARKEHQGIWNPETAWTMTVEEPYLIRAKACEFEKDYGAAIEHWKQGLQEPFGFPAVIWMHIAKCYDKLGDHEETLSAYDEVLKVSLDEKAFLGKAHLISRKEGVEKAERWLDDFEKKYPNVSDFDVHRGTFHMDEKRYGRAIEIFSRHLSVVMQEKKISFDEHGKLEVEVVSGRERWKNYFTLDPLLGKLAECYRLAGDAKSALRCATMGITAGQAKFRGQVDSEPNEKEAGDAACRLVRARLWLASGRIAEAKIDLEAAKVLKSWTLQDLDFKAVEAAIQDAESAKPAK